MVFAHDDETFINAYLFPLAINNPSTVFHFMSSKTYLERLRRHPAALAILYVYAQRLICWFRIGFGRLEYDVERDKAKMSKRLQSGELFQDPPSRPEAPRSAELQQNKQTVAEGCSFSESIKNDAFCKVFASVAASISGKRANGCRGVRFF